jgi:hypothetical protein
MNGRILKVANWYWRPQADIKPESARLRFRNSSAAQLATTLSSLERELKSCVRHQFPRFEKRDLRLRECGGLAEPQYVCLDLHVF